jgi:hypothetical protein
MHNINTGLGDIMSKHKVKTHHWNSGILSVVEHFFDDLEEALLFSNNVDSHGVKVYNPDDELIHHIPSKVVPDENNQRETYA